MIRQGRPQLLLAVAVTVHLAVLVRVVSLGYRPEGAALVVWVGVSWATFGGAAVLLLRTPLARPLLLVGCAAVLLQVPGVLVEARTSSDSLRYVWDGRVQLSGTSPYAYVPRDPALAGLRDEFLFPGGEVRIGRSDVPTIYPPAAQLYFAVVAAVTPWSAGTAGVRVGGALAAVLTTVLLGRLLRRTGGDPRWAGVWGWCPLVLLEAGNNAHVDVVSTAAVVLTFGAMSAGRDRLTGFLWAVAVLVKLVPGLLAPVVLRRRPVTVLGVAATAVVLAYLPHVLAVGPAVVGYLPGYLEEEGYDGGRRFAVLRLVVPDSAALPVALAVALAVAVLAYVRTDPERPWMASTWLVGAALVVAAPGYHWYALLLVACVALSRRWEWLAVAAAGYPAYLATDYGARNGAVQAVAYGGALLVVVGITLARGVRARVVTRAEPPGAPGTRRGISGPAPRARP